MEMQALNATALGLLKTQLKGEEVGVKAVENLPSTGTRFVALFENKNKTQCGWHCGIVGNVVTCEAGIPKLVSSCATSYSAPSIARMGKKQRMAQAFQTLHPCESLSNTGSGFVPAQTLPCGHLGSESVAGRPLSFSPSLTIAWPFK